MADSTKLDLVWSISEYGVQIDLDAGHQTIATDFINPETVSQELERDINAYNQGLTSSEELEEWEELSHGLLAMAGIIQLKLSGVFLEDT